MKNFKFTWGHGLVLALLSFMIFIVSFLVRFQMQQGNSMDLVTEDYYNEGLNYQSKFEALQNAEALQEKPSIDVENNQLVIAFPRHVSTQNGSLDIYRPSDKTLDHHFDLRLDNHQMRIKENAFQTGKYIIQIYWEDSAKTPYLMKKEVIWK